MDAQIRQQIQQDAARLGKFASMTAEEYAEAMGKSNTAYIHAAQLGGVQAYVDSLLFWLKEAGLYEPPVTVPPGIRNLLDATGRAPSVETSRDAHDEPYPAEVQ